MSYKHLTLVQRYHIQAYISMGYHQKEIAEQIGVHPSTVSREIRRNKGKRMGVYFGHGAHDMYKARQQALSTPAPYGHRAGAYVDSAPESMWTPCRSVCGHLSL